MRKKAIVFLILYCLTVFAGCSVNQKRELSSEINTPIHSSTADIRQETEEHSEKKDCNPLRKRS